MIRLSTHARKTPPLFTSTSLFTFAVQITPMYCTHYSTLNLFPSFGCMCTFCTCRQFIHTLHNIDIHTCMLCSTVMNETVTLQSIPSPSLPSAFWLSLSPSLYIRDGFTLLVLETKKLMVYIIMKTPLNLWEGKKIFVGPL